MPVHLDLREQIQDAFGKWKVQLSFLRFTAQKMKLRLPDINSQELEKYKLKRVTGITNNGNTILYVSNAEAGPCSWKN